MSTHEVVVYGASGYTGKLIAWKLAEAGIPFVAAGRNQQRLEEQMAKVPELQGHDYICRAADHDVESLTELLRGKKVVYNVVGPFMQTGEPVVQAALAAGCSYLDTTGETDWMFMLKRDYGQKFADAGLLLCPATSWMWAAGLLATEIALETQGIDTLEVAYLGDSNTSVASTKSFLRMCTHPQYFLEHDELVMWPYAEAYTVNIPGHHRCYMSLPWSGGGETVWYEDDDRVRNCQTLVAFKDQVMFSAVHGVLKDFEEKHRDAAPEAQEQATNTIGGTIVSEEPGREDPIMNRCVVSCQGRGNNNSVSVVLRGNSPYIQTGVFAAEACRRILAGGSRAKGFCSPARAFGHRELLASIAEQGYLAWTEVSV